MGASRNTALVTGATGFIGKRLAERLLEAGWLVRLLVRNPAKIPPSLAKTDIIIGGLDNDKALADAVRGSSVVFHCAANVHTWDTQAAYALANIDGVQHLLQAIESHNPSLARFVHVSSVDVYGFPKTPCDENSPTPLTGFGYGDSKIAGEALVRQSSLPWTILRPSNVIGPHSQFIERIGIALTSDLMLSINGGCVNAGFLHIDNLIDYMLWAAQAPQATGQCYNVRDMYDVNWVTFLKRFRKAIKGRGHIVNLPFGVAYAAAWTMEQWYRLCMPSQEPLLHRLLVCIFGRTCGHNADKIRAASGIQSTIGFDEAMERSIRWFLHER